MPQYLGEVHEGDWYLGWLCPHRMCGDKSQVPQGDPANEALAGLQTYTKQIDLNRFMYSEKWEEKWV